MSFPRRTPIAHPQVFGLFRWKDFNQQSTKRGSTMFIAMKVDLSEPFLQLQSSCWYNAPKTRKHKFLMLVLDFDGR
jgi:hypothetical protein